MEEYDINMDIDTMQDILINPYYAINIDETLADSHEPMVSEDEWVRVQIRTITEDTLGVKVLELTEDQEQRISEYFHRLLNVLKGDYLTPIDKP